MDKTYNFRNVIDEIKSFQASIHCPQKIFLFYTLPATKNRILFPIEDLARYALAPCEIKLMNQWEKQQGYILVHDKTLTEKYHNYIYMTSPQKEFSLIKFP